MSKNTKQYAKNAIALLCGALLLSGCDQDSRFISDAEKRAAEQLKDPASAQFKRETFIVRHPASEDANAKIAACGFIDGKNSFGAYTGGVRFVALGLHHQTQDEIGIYRTVLEDPTDQRATADSYNSDGTPKEKMTTIFEKLYWNEYCTDATHFPTYTGVGR